MFGRKQWTALEPGQNVQRTRTCRSDAIDRREMATENGWPAKRKANSCPPQRGSTRSHGLTGRLHPPFMIRPDITVAIERGAWYSTGKSKWGTELVDQGFYGPLESPFTDEQRTEIPYINTICELVRNGQMDLYQIPTIEDEKRKSPKRHSDHMGCVNVDHGIKYRDLGFECARPLMHLVPATHFILLRDYPLYVR